MKKQLGKEALRQLKELVLQIEVDHILGMRESLLRYATNGDWRPLANYIRDGGRVTPEMRPFLANVLDGKIRRPAKKISKAETESRNCELFYFVWKARLRGEKEKEYSKRAEDRFGRTWRQLQKILASIENREVFEEASSVLLQFETAATETFGVKLPEDRRWQGSQKCPRPAHRSVPKYMISDMALTPHTMT